MEPPTSQPDLTEIKVRSVKSGVITMGSQLAGIGIQLVSTVVLARVLTPEDYGILAMVGAVTAFAAVFRDLGLSAAAVQKDQLSPEQASNLFWLNTAAGALFTLLIAALAPVVAWYYQRPEALWITVLCSLTFVLGGLGSQPGAMLVRKLRFGQQAVANLAGSLSGFGITLVLALQDWKYWSLAIGSVSGAAITTALLLWFSPPSLTTWRQGIGLKAMLKFGADVAAFDIVNYFQRNLDNLLLGRWWGAAHLGQYSRGYALLMLPISSIRTPIIAVAYPAMSRLSSNPALHRDYYLKTTAMIAGLTMPIAGLCFVLAEPLILTFLGPDWPNVAPVFAALAPAALVQPTAGFVGPMLLSLGLSRTYLKCGIFNAVIICSGFLIGLQWGPVGVAISYSVANYLVLWPWLRWAHANSTASLREFISTWISPILSTLISAAAVLPIQAAIGEVHPWLVLCLTGSAFGVFYILLLNLSSSGRALLQHYRFAFAVLSAGVSA